MLQTVALASLIATSSWIVAPVARPAGAQATALATRKSFVLHMQDSAAGEPAPVAEATVPAMEASEESLTDFTEDLLDALAADDSPLSEMDASPGFVKNSEAEEQLEPLASYTNAMTVEDAKMKYRLHENDCGSSQVQIAVLSARIQYLTTHMQENKKDYASLRGLSAMVTRRRKLLEYLLSEDVDEFKRLTSELGIRTTQLLKPKLAGARGRRL
ncbi:hypothetical protein AB1Y20_003748 [Prymnesium parvum]|uniref:30S ribosomal protein S15 n=1 Tax=Prymnesium parvum TaxID=97485 RepID=A0AB34J4R7_PRYPA